MTLFRGLYGINGELERLFFMQGRQMLVFVLVLLVMLLLLLMAKSAGEMRQKYYRRNASPEGGSTKDPIDAEQIWCQMDRAEERITRMETILMNRRGFIAEE